MTLTLTPAGSRIVRLVMARRLADISQIVARIPIEMRGPLRDAITSFSEAGSELLDHSSVTAWEI